MRRSALWLVGTLLVAGCDEEPGARDAGVPDGGPPPPWPVNAMLVEASPEATTVAGRIGDDAAILPGGRRVTPAGTQIEVGGFLLGLRLLGDGTHLVTTDGGYGDEYLSVIDTATGAIVQQEPYRRSEGRALFLGLAERPDGTVFASGGGTNAIYRYRYRPANATPLAAEDEWPVDGNMYVSGLALDGDARLLAAYQAGDALGVWDIATATEVARVPLGNGQEPYDVVVDAARREAYVSMWGGGTVAVVDLAAEPPVLVTKIPVGKNPEALLLDPPAAPARLLVANSDSDSISVLDLDSRLLLDEVPVAHAADGPRGAAPNHMALSPDGTRLYVANAGENCLDVLDASGFDRIGRVPTGWYPTGVAVASDGTLYVTNAKGMGGGPTTGDHIDYGILRGTVSVVAAPSEADLAAGLSQVEANLYRPRDLGARVSCPDAETCRFPLPPEPGLPTPIEHVVLIVRENKTFDANLGDLGGEADGDPSLVLFGEEITPNLHALAREFVVGDNFYSNAEASIQGHQWTAGGTSNDFTEKAWLTTWGRGTHTLVDFSKRISAPEQGYYFQHLARAGIDYVDLGEIVGLAAGGGGDPAVVIDSAWPGGVVFNLDVKDVARAEYFDFKVDVDRDLPRFTYMLLPNNHTEGLTPGKWTPEYMVADNDEATGRVVETLSHSPFWPTTIVFIIEDDPQDGADHVEAHRSTLVVASPWVKRHMTTHLHYDVPSLWRTIELLLGLPPMSEYTATAAPMFDIFATEPDYTPYVHIPSNVPEARNPSKPGDPLVETSLRMDFSTIDNAPGLGRLLWHHRKGAPAPWASMPLPVDHGDEIELPVLGTPAD